MANTILLVDDEVNMLMLLKKAFETKGYTIVTAENSVKALEVLQNENIQVMFLDLRLPGMNGIELCRTIRKENPIACIYAMTGYKSQYELSECRDAGFDDYFVKPINLNIFFKTAEKAFDNIGRLEKKRSNESKGKREKSKREKK